MEPDWLIVADQQVTSLRSAMSHGAGNLKVIPKLLRGILERGLWKRRLVAQRREIAEFDSFPKFVTDPAPDGLGTTVETLKKFCQSAGELEVVDLIDQATERPTGRPKAIVNNIDNTERPRGTSVGRALRDLRNKEPELHQRVIAGDLSPHAAMIEAGLRVRTHTIPHDPERAAAAIRRLFNEEEVSTIKSLL
jgi:hypothetical protein